MQRRPRGFGTFEIVFRKCEMPLSRRVGERLLRRELFARRLAVQKMHVRVQQNPPQLTPWRI